MLVRASKRDEESERGRDDPVDVENSVRCQGDSSEKSTPTLGADQPDGRALGRGRDGNTKQPMLSEREPDLHLVPLKVGLGLDFSAEQRKAWRVLVLAADRVELAP